MSDSEFDDELFGELVHPTPASEQFHELIQANTKKNIQFNKCPEKLPEFPQRFKENRLNVPQREIQDKEALQPSKEKSVATTRFTSDFGFLQQNQRHKNKTYQIKVLGQDDLFECNKCKGKPNSNSNCFICQGKNVLDGNHNLLKFMQYITDYKLGVKTSYKDEASSKNKIEFPKTSSNKVSEKKFKYSSAIRYKTKRSYGQRKKNQIDQCDLTTSLAYKDFKEKPDLEKTIHTNIQCDICDILPIVGKRFHCKHEECSSDYDLCQKCYESYGHNHKMQEIGIQKKLQKMKSYQNLIVKALHSSKIKPSQEAISKQQKFKYLEVPTKSPRIFLSSIH